MWNSGVLVERVSDLYRRHARLNVKGFYEDGETNPFAPLCALVPETANYFATVFMDDEARVDLARLTLSGLARRRKIKEAIRKKSDLNINQFGRTDDVLVLWV